MVVKFAHLPQKENSSVSETANNSGGIRNSTSSSISDYDQGAAYRTTAMSREAIRKEALAAATPSPAANKSKIMPQRPSSGLSDSSSVSDYNPNQVTQKTSLPLPGERLDSATRVRNWVTSSPENVYGKTWEASSGSKSERMRMPLPPVPRESSPPVPPPTEA